MLQINHRPFFDGYREAFGPLKQEQIDGLAQLLRSIEADEALDEDDLCAVAYMLATVKHECADMWTPIVERGARWYFDQYELGTEKAKRVGNTQPGDGYLYRGRGYVQITGRANYARMNDVLHPDVDILQHPDSALVPAVAYAILAIGMREGLFTGKTLSDYCDGRKSDYVGARRIINGTDQAQLIAGYAAQFEVLLTAATDEDPWEDERLAVPTPLPSQIPTPPIYLPPPPKNHPTPRLSFWRRIWGAVS